MPLIISISGDQFEEKENIPEEFIFNDESNLYMFVLVTVFLIKSLDHFISIFRFNSSPWFFYDGLASRQTKIIKQLARNWKFGFLVFIKKQAGSDVSYSSKASGTDTFNGH